MTARTHDLGALTALTLVICLGKAPAMSVPTAAVAVMANMLGGLFPDLDESSAAIWQKIRGGSVLGKMISPLLGGHRLITHSILGVWATGWLLNQILSRLSTIVLVEMQWVWWAFMLGLVSHLVLDALTKEGIPLFFPLPWAVGWPPFKFLRIKTGSLMEKSLIFPGMIALNAYLLMTYKEPLWTFVHQLSR